jgi:hypothetical protein
MCHILLEISQWGLQLFFKIHLNWRSAHKVMDIQSCKNPNFGNFGTKWHLGASLMAKHKEYYKGEGGGFPPSPCGESCESMFARDLSVHQKCFDYASTNLLFGLCRSMWINESLVIRPSPISELQHTLLPPKCYKPWNVLQLLLLPMSSPFDLQLSPSKSLGVHHTMFT